MYGQKSHLYILQLNIWLVFCFNNSVDKVFKKKLDTYDRRRHIYILQLIIWIIFFCWHSLRYTEYEQWNMDTYIRDVTHIHIYIYIYSSTLGFFFFFLNVLIIHVLWRWEAIGINYRVSSCSQVTHVLEYWSDLELLFLIPNLESGFVARLK